MEGVVLASVMGDQLILTDTPLPNHIKPWCETVGFTEQARNQAHQAGTGRRNQLQRTITEAS